MAVISQRIPFNDRVAQAITDHCHIGRDKIIVLENSAKYSPGGIPKTVRGREYTDQLDGLSDIFDTVAQINHGALDNSTLCAGPSSGEAFRDALFRSVDELARLAGGRPIRYVELGPEPWKSRAILSRMIVDRGARLHQYVGVDINPESREPMRRALVPVVGEDRFTYWIQDFYEASASGYPGVSSMPGTELPDDLVTVVTNLGFQEGNDLPSRVGPMLEALTRPGDLVLAEMQVVVFDSDGEIDSEVNDTILKFYQHPEMRRQAALTGQQLDGSSIARLAAADASASINGIASCAEPDPYIVNIVPLDSEVGNLNVATTLYAVTVEDTQKYLLMNSCVKYTRHQFDSARELTGAFKVKAVHETGDRSIVFQIAERQ